MTYYEPKTQWVSLVHNGHLTVHEFVHVLHGRTLAQVFEETWNADGYKTFEYLGVKYDTLAEACVQAMGDVIERTMRALAEVI